MITRSDRFRMVVVLLMAVVLGGGWGWLSIQLLKAGAGDEQYRLSEPVRGKAAVR